ncbi:DUF1028 domain-containing protein [Haladaptatus sp. DYF46]|uniref:DUF1028 domain-containing protein n=1 Tax=Haladaptatus sp. DYF46 TaxID=2886041 RepID=UPI001E413708|nr:DUF1028 domain-containing protein [Haladaptatus sp. DYF46]
MTRPATPRPSTFSIVARDPEQDAVGVAVQSKFISVGSVVPFVSADAGAIATQSFANVAYGPDGHDLLRRGKSAKEVVMELTGADPEFESRQVGVVKSPVAMRDQGISEGSDEEGETIAAFTGVDCFDYAGDIQGDHYTVQGNILENRETLEAMAETFEESEGGLPERLIGALHAGNDAGGDKRGEQSAALYIAKPEGGYEGRNDRWVDVRVDDHEKPIDELERIFKIYDVTLLEREEADETQELTGDTAERVSETLVELGLFDGTPSATFGEGERGALEDFRGMNNFENHSIPVLEDALARGWDDADGDGEERMVDALWHGLSRLDRK